MEARHHLGLGMLCGTSLVEQYRNGHMGVHYVNVCLDVHEVLSTVLFYELSFVFHLFLAVSIMIRCQMSMDFSLTVGEGGSLDLLFSLEVTVRSKPQVLVH